ncbi:hypothetical protein M0R45_003566 [Rubus argutus]|uniref:Uncharacterized protein n=1 Tax=Rubus argutus TaxID=59490 RepID=A0AAW1YGU4_RUBAR
MAPYTRAATSKSIALRMKALQMKRSCNKVPSACEGKGANSPIKVKAMSPKKKSPVKVSPKKTASKSGNGKSISNKTMSSNGSNSKKQCKSSKLKKAEEVSVNITGGLRLLKRGMVTMNRITRRLLRGKKLKVVFNAKGEPIGTAAKEMQSYIGVLARSKVPISVPDWREVDPEIKQKIWECIEMSFVVPKELRKLVVTSAANKWREFKCKLTKWYILPYIDSPELLEFPPDDYRSIEKADWDIFVANRISADFQELREIQIEKRKENKYPHRMARKGYANLQEELSETLTEEELDRATMWIKARQDKNGNFKQEEVEQKAKKIIKLQRKVLKESSPLKELMIRLSVEDTVRKSVRAILEEEKEAIIAKERAIWVERLAKLEAELEGKTLHGDSAKPVTPRNEHVSAQGSCSRQGEHGMKEGESDEVKTVKKMLTLKDDVNLFVQENIVEEPEVKKKLESIMEHEDQNGMDAKKVEIHQVVNTSLDVHTLI